MKAPNGQTKKLLLSLLLATILGAGAWVFWGMACAVFSTVRQHTFSRPRMGINLLFTDDGHPLLQSWDPPYYLKITYRTLEGQLIEDPNKLVLQEQSYANTNLAPPGAIETDGLQWSLRIRGWASVRPAVAFWYLVREDENNNLAYFAGYDSTTRQLIGYLSRAGFGPDVPPLDQRFAIKTFWHGESYAPSPLASHGTEPRNTFEEGAEAVVLVVSDSKLYRVDFRRQAVELIAMPDAVVSVGTLSEPIPVSDDRRVVFKERIVVRFAEYVLILDLTGETLNCVPLPKELRRFAFALFDTTGGDWIAVRNGGGTWQLPTDMYWFGPDGTITRHEQVKLMADIAESPRSMAWQAATALPSPLPFAIASLVVQPRGRQTTALAKVGLVDHAEPLDFETALSQVFAEVWLPLLVVCLLGALLAVVCYRHHRRYETKGALFWAIFVFLSGPPGLVGYWLHRRWPAKEQCTSCGKVAPRDRETCVACGAQFPLPEARGTEIFA